MGFAPYTDETKNEWIDAIESAIPSLERQRALEEDYMYELQRRQDELAASGYHELIKLVKALRHDSNLPARGHVTKHV